MESVSPVAQLEAPSTVPDMIRVLIVSNVRLYADGLAELLGRSRGMTVVGAVANLHETLQNVAALRPDVVLVDLGREASGEPIARIRSRVCAEIIALGVAETDEEVFECAKAGVSGYVTRSASLAELVNTVESVSRGEILCSPRIAGALFRRAGALAHQSTGPIRRLTRRETEIVDLVASGLSNKQIAQRLFIEVGTVKNHLHNVFEKLQVHSRTEAIMVARSAGQLGGTTSM